VCLNGLTRRLPLTGREVRALARRCPPPKGADGGEVSLAFVDDDTMARVNRKFLGRDGPTDVIAFRLDESPPAAGDRTVGEILVAWQTAQRQAERRRVAWRDELALYVVHGLLHLAGYDDGSPASRRCMYAEERNVLEGAGYSYVR